MVFLMPLHFDPLVFDFAFHRCLRLFSPAIRFARRIPPDRQEQVLVLLSELIARDRMQKPASQSNPDVEEGARRQAAGAGYAELNVKQFAVAPFHEIGQQAPCGGAPAP